MTDTERLNWLEKQSGSALVSDDDVHWAVSTTGIQNVPVNAPQDIHTTFFIKKDEWHKSVRDAIDAAMKNDLD